MYKDYSSGKGDKQALQRHLSDQIGKNPELEAYMTKNPTSAEYSKIVKYSRMGNQEKAEPQAPVKTLDVYFHRGTMQNRTAVNDPTTNPRQDEITASIKEYMTGKLNKDEFVSALYEHEIPVTERVNTLIRNTEAGNVPPFCDFGKEILRQTYGCDKYNRVDKVQLNNNRIVTPGHAGRPFGLAAT